MKRLKEKSERRGGVGRRLVGAGLALIMALGVSGTAFAVPEVGSARRDTTLLDAWERTVPLSQFDGMPLLFIYEDKGSATQNTDLKAELSTLAKGDRYRKTIALVAVADVSDYDFWPAKGFVKDAIRDESRKQGIVIYCDWDGSLRRKLDLNHRASNVVLYGRDGRVLFSRAGTLSRDERGELIRLLRLQVESRSS